MALALALEVVLVVGAVVVVVVVGRGGRGGGSIVEVCAIGGQRRVGVNES